MGKQRQKLRQWFRIPSPGAIVHLLVVEIIVNSGWWALTQWFVSDGLIHDLGFLVLSAMTIVAVAWYLTNKTKKSEQKSQGNRTEPAQRQPEQDGRATFVRSEHEGAAITLRENRLGSDVEGVTGRFSHLHAEGNIYGTTGVPTSIEFFLHRPDLAWYRGKLKATKTAWALWIIGESAATANLLSECSFTKLLILSPANVPQIAAMMRRSASDAESMESAILKLTAQNQLKVKDSVRWYSAMTPSLITIGDPQEETAWVYLETFVAGMEADQRPAIFFTKKDHPKMFREVVDAYLRSWDSAKVLATPSASDKVDSPNP